MEIPTSLSHLIPRVNSLPYFTARWQMDKEFSRPHVQHVNLGYKNLV